MSPWETFWIIPPPPQIPLLFLRRCLISAGSLANGRATGKTSLLVWLQALCNDFLSHLFRLFFFFDYKVDVHLVFQFPTSCYELCVDFFGTLSVRRKKKVAPYSVACWGFSFISNRDSFTSSSFSFGCAQRFNGEKSFEEIAHSARQRLEGTPVSLWMVSVYFFFFCF